MTTLYDPADHPEPLDTEAMRSTRMSPVDHDAGAQPSTVRPVVSNFSPGLPGPIQPSDTVGFDVTVADATLLTIVTVSAIFKGTDETEAVYDGASFETLYAQNSSVIAITNGLRFSIKRRGGWPVNIQLKVRAISASGQINA